MSNQRGSIQSANMSRRDFFKVTAGAAAAVSVASVAVPPFGMETAFAAEALADGAYRVNANLYISKNLVLIKKNAYFTNPADPNLSDDIPETPATGLNADLAVSGGVATVTVPLVNECFMLLSAESGSNVTVVGTETAPGIYKDGEGKTPTRISKITLELANMNGAYALGACNEYAAYMDPPFPMNMLVPDYLDWPATLAVDFSAAVPA